MKFEKIIIPPGWQESFTKYPNGRTIFEALSATITTVNEGIEEVNQKVNQGLIAIDQAENTIRQEITEIFDTFKLQLEAEITDLSDDLIADFALLQSEVLTLIAGKANAADVYTKQQVDAQLADIENDLSDKAQKLKATNLVTNGDFSQGKTGWQSTYASTAANESGRLAITATNQYGYIGQQVPTIVNNKYYFAGTIEGTSNNYLIVQGIGTTSKILPSNGIHRLSVGFVATGASHIISAGDARTSGWTKFWLDNVIVINLTATFGAGNEPTKEQMDRLLAEFPNSWFNGTQEILPLKIVNSLGAIQPPAVAPTLLNGRTGTLSYDYTNSGLIMLKGTASGGTLNTNIMVLRAGHRPASTLTFPIVANGVFGVVTINNLGEVRQTAGALTNVNFDGIVFKAVQ